VTLDRLTAISDGTPKDATATTVPPGLNVTYTYDGSATAPIHAGSYTVVGTVNDINYQGTAAGTLLINRANQTITFPPLPDKTVGDASFTLTGSASSFLPMSYISSNPNVATVSGSTVTIVASGSAVITASQTGNTDYNPAPNVSRTLTVLMPPEPPTFSVASGHYATNLSVVLNSSASGAVIRYTVNETEPTASSPSVALGGTLLINRPTTLKAKAFVGTASSDTASATYIVTGWIAAGPNHTLALRSDGSIYAWGLNTNGQLGNGTTALRPTAVPVKLNASTPLTNIVDLSTSSIHSLAVSEGNVWAWGSNWNGQLGTGNTRQQLWPVKAKIGPNTDLANIVHVAAGITHSLALDTSGQVWVWGSNNVGQLGLGTADTNTHLYAVRLNSLTNVVAIAAGNNCSLALRSDGTVWTWGTNANGQLGDGTRTQQNAPVQVKVNLNGTTTNLTGITDTAIGATHMLAVKNDGTVWAWGLNHYGQLGDDTITTKNVATRVSNVTGAVAVAAGATHSVALKSDGRVLAWGSNSQGQLGDGTLETRKTPVTMLGVNGIQVISAGANRTIYIKADGTVSGVGENFYAPLGNGVIGFDPTPAVIPVDRDDNRQGSGRRECA